MTLARKDRYCGIPVLIKYIAAVDLGLVEAVGVCNYKIPQLQQFHSLMLARDIPIASNQVKGASCLTAVGLSLLGSTSAYQLDTTSF